MKDYFATADLFVEFESNNVENCLLHNEPQGGGRDYRLIPSLETHQRLRVEAEVDGKGMSEGNIKKIQDAFASTKRYQGAFAWEADAEPDGSTIDILAPHEELPDDEPGDPFVDAFKAVLRFKNDSEEFRHKDMSREETMNRLQDPEMLVDIRCFQQLPKGIQAFMREMSFFKKLFDEGTQLFDENFDGEGELHGADLSEVNSMGVPEPWSDSLEVSAKACKSSTTLSSSSLTSSSSPCSNKARPSRSLRSSSSSQVSNRSSALARTKAELQSTPPSRKPRSKKQLVEKPRMNPRMGQWIDNFTTRKRRRESSSSDSPTE